MPQRFSLFATAARGTEDLLAQELAELGATRIRQDRGGVRFWANWIEALRICLWTRIAMRVLYPLGQFQAEGSEGLYRASSEVAWEEHLTSSSTFAVEATLRDSEHTHSGFVALKIKDAIADRLRKKLGSRPDVDTANPDVQIVAHLAGPTLSLALDLCGEPLNRRGYRVRTTLAPLKETLAAAILRVAGYSGQESLIDPLCGSGTFLIEAAMIASSRAPGISRSFAVERWPSAGAQAREILQDLKADARKSEHPPAFPIRGIDRDEEAVDSARRNARAAGLGKAIEVAIGDVTEPLAVQGLTPGLLVTNPPYGDRLKAGGQKGMKSFYFKLGETLAQLRDWRAFILAGNPVFESAFHARPHLVRTLWNGPIECRLMGYVFPSSP